MKSFTRIGLPILLVVAVVFGITFIRVYSPEDSNPSNDSSVGPKEGTTNKDRPIRFYTTRAVKGTTKSTPKYLWYWDSTVEVGAPGHFEFWGLNRHADPVTIRVPATNCQCAGAEMAVVPPDAYRDYAALSALAGSPLAGAPSPLAALAHVRFNQSLNWLPLFKDGDRPDQTIPAATTPTAPQFAIVRLAWKGKGEPGKKGISAEVYTSVGEATPWRDVLSAETDVVPAFDMMRHEGSEWKKIHELSVGELRENGVVKEVLYLASYTRAYALYTITAEHPTSCISWTDAVPATQDEIDDFNEFLRGKDNKLLHVQGLYKIEITVRERTNFERSGNKEFHQLDLGPLDQRFTVAAVDAGHWPLTLTGRVLGEVTVLSGADGGRIDLGNAIAADQGASKHVTLLADRPGLDLSLVPDGTTPNYLQVKLRPLKSLPDGRKQWRLSVTIPKGIYGSLPRDSCVILKTNGPSPRRLRFPIHGATYDSGGPRL